MTTTIKDESLEYGEITGYKCGELFVSQRGIFYLNCHFCDKTFYQLHYFANHFLEEHNFDIQESTIQFNTETSNNIINNASYIPIQTVPSPGSPPESAVHVEKITHMFKPKQLIDIPIEDDIDVVLSGNETTNNNIKIEDSLINDDHLLLDNEQQITTFVTEEIVIDEKPYITNTNPTILTYSENLPNGKLKCKMCSKVFTVMGMKVHINKHYELIKCQAVDCKERFLTQNDLNEHIIIAHRNNLAYPFECNICKKIFRLKIRLQQHYRRFHMREKNFKCVYCGKCFFLKNEMKNHESFHTGIKSYVCEKCGKAFAVRQRLLNHIKAVHPSGKLYNCELCLKKFNHPDVLKRHLECHIEGKPFKCDICMKTFKRKHSLKSHTDIVHNNLEKNNKEKNHFCDVCGRGFVQKRNLSFHKKSH